MCKPDCFTPTPYEQVRGQGDYASKFKKCRYVGEPKIVFGGVTLEKYGFLQPNQHADVRLEDLQDGQWDVLSFISPSTTGGGVLSNGTDGGPRTWTRPGA